MKPIDKLIIKIIIKLTILLNYLTKIKNAHGNFVGQNFYDTENIYFLYYY